LFGDEIADSALGSDASSRSRAFDHERRRNEPLGDEAIEGSRLVEWNESGYRLAVVRDCHFLAITDRVEVAAEVISQLSDSSFHPMIMALSDQGI
jgi:hypothetical protein